ncbi:MAG: XdhC family protein [Gemmatimonadota bacterium]
MKHWAESRQVFEWLATLAVEQRRAAVATVVSVRGSAYRREGARMAVAEDGASVGNVSGGCLEGDVREVALQVIASGVPQLRSYCSGADQVSAWDLGVGCEGEVKVYVEPAETISLVEDELLRGMRPFAICRELPTAEATARRIVLTMTTADGSLGDSGLDRRVIDRAREQLRYSGFASTLVEVDGRTLFIECFEPPPHLVILSAGNDARPLARMAVEVGFRVTVVDRRPALLAADRFPDDAELVECEVADLTRRVPCGDDTFAVVMNHNFAEDEQYLRALVGTRVPYIGMLGPRQRTERMIRNVSAHVPFDIERIYGPVGLDVGTDGAEQVALAIIAEILAVRGGRSPASLRERQRAIHVESA